MKDLRIFKLITGEEIIGEVIEGQGNSPGYEYKVKNISMLMVNQSEKGFGVVPVPWAMNVKDGEVTLLSEHVIYTGEPRKELIEMYEKIFSPLALPTKSLITG